MTSPTNHNETSKKISIEKQNRIDAHKRIASHLERAAKNHNDAAKYYEENNIEKAVMHASVASEHLTKANEFFEEFLLG